MRGIHRWAAAGLLSAAMAVTVWGATASAATHPATPATVSHSAVAAGGGGLMEVRQTRIGTVLANPRGFTVYYFLVDKRGSGKSSCYGQCAALWPAVIGPVRFPAGLKLPGAVGYITRTGGARQLTIGGWPIYTFAGDKAPGQANGQGLGHVWYVIKVK
jgi:predicted lipoprotein with Yx(FWY)xxD motif